MKLSLNAQILLAAVFGVAIGFFLFHLGPESSITTQTVYYCGIIGKIFVSLLKMILIPLVFTSITVGIANLRAHAQMQKVWRLSLLYYFSTTALAVILGLFAVNMFKPGANLQMAMFQDAINQSTMTESLTIPQFIENFLANLFVNPIQAMANSMVLPTIMFALFLGIALIIAGDKAKTTLNLMNELFQLIMMIVNWIMKVLPIGICALLIKLVATQDPSFFKSLGTFIAVVIGTTLFHGFITLPLLLIT
ncbi:MAG: cation:dicarboxylase symporter family transporter, partial [Candidatus Omnitrophica bacterium]|nr:cation:dicarboxylase symporter family transporter [Candidatus Omnitrophota bacterium]